MSAGLPLLLLGVSHRTAALDVREALTLDDPAIEAKLRELRGLEGVAEVWLLSTCLRTEVLVAGSGEALPDATHEAVASAVFGAAPREAVYAHRDLEALLHLFRVSAGLDSVVLGESQVLAQVKEAFARAVTAGGAGPLFHALFQRALAAGRRVRRETSVGQGTLSIARAAIDVAARVFGDFEDVTTLIVGAGETGRLAARHLRDERAGRLVFVNRTRERAERVARELGGEADGLERLPEAMRRADLVLACVENAPNLVDQAALRYVRPARRDRPLVLIDLSVPRAVDPELAERAGVLVFDLDDLARIVRANREERERAAEEAAPILLAEVHKFLSLRHYATFRPTIERLHERFEGVREEELDACVAGETPPELLALAHRLTRHLLDVALEELKESAREAVAPESVDQAYQRYLERR